MCCSLHQNTRDLDTVKASQVALRDHSFLDFSPLHYAARLVLYIMWLFLYMILCS